MGLMSEHTRVAWSLVGNLVLGEEGLTMRPAVPGDRRRFFRPQPITTGSVAPA